MPRLPHPDRVRVLLSDPRQTPADHDRNGDAFFAEGRLNVAMMFYEKSKSRDRLEKTLRAAGDSGDTFLVEWVFKVLPELVTPQDWIRTGEAAMKAGKYSFARDAFLRAGDEARAQEAVQALNQALG
ncbi:MAG: hypothetical protein HY716_02250 [Planctomycetes bacterium]|nr:hypothetical protein [Planctomycetota bacterium]